MRREDKKKNTAYKKGRLFLNNTIILFKKFNNLKVNNSTLYFKEKDIIKSNFIVYILTIGGLSLIKVFLDLYNLYKSTPTKEDTEKEQINKELSIEGTNENVSNSLNLNNIWDNYYNLFNEFVIYNGPEIIKKSLALIFLILIVRAFFIIIKWWKS